MQCYRFERSLRGCRAWLRAAMAWLGRQAPARTQRRASWVAAGLLALVALVALVALPLQAQAQTETTLVSNIGQTALPTTLTVSPTQSLAIGFETGDNPPGYVLTEVAVNMNRTGGSSSDAPDLWVCPEDSNDRPSTSINASNCTALVAPAVFSNGVNTFSAPAGNIELESGTLYFVVATESSFPPPTYLWSTTSSSMADAGAAAGWGIGLGLFSILLSSWTELEEFPLVAIKGYAVPDPNPVRTLVSTITNSLVGSQGVGGASNVIVAQRFTVGPADSYLLSSVTVRVGGTSSGGVDVAIHEVDGVNPADTALHLLSRPSGSGAGDRTHTVQSNDATLEAGEDYFVLVTGSSTGRLLETTSSDSEIGIAGWEVADTYRVRSTPSGGAAASWSTGSRALQVRLEGVVFVRSDDATLSALTLADASDGGSPIEFNETFAAGTTAYTVDVANGVDEVTLSATATDMVATVAIADDSNAATPGVATFSLSEGATALMVTVTAEDDSTTQTYTVTVTRAMPPALVSNIQSGGGSTSVTTSTIMAQRFTVEPDNDYLLSSVTIVANGTSSDINVGIHEVASNGNNPANTPLYSLTPPSGSATGERTYTVQQADATLEADTDYFVYVTGPSGSRSVATTPSNGETGIIGWTIADDARRRASGTWNDFANALQMRLDGVVLVRSDDATLSALTLADDSGGAVRLAPAFASGTLDYAAGVGNAVDTVMLTATPTDDGATVSTVTLGGNIIVDDDFSNGITVPSLLEGDNTIVVTVTAEDTTTTQDYTVTVTRHAPLLTPPADAVWSAVLTPVTFSDVLGCTITTDPSQVCSNPATLSEDSFTHDSVDYTITSLNTFFSPTAGTSLGRLDIQFDTGLTTATQALILVVDGDEYPFIDADNMTALGRQWENTGLDATWPAGVPVAVWLVEPPSDDATLSDLSLANASDGTAIPLNETFVPTLITYTANVLNDVTSITITPERSDDVNAAFEIQNDSGMMITDADTNTTGLQVALDVGETVIKVKVTAEDMSTETYTVTVTRAMAVTPPADALVSNTGQTSHNNSRVVGVSGALKLTQAQQFTTGDNAGGYTLSAIDVLANDFKLLSSPRVRIYTTTSGNPGTPLYVLTNPGTLADDAINTFTAPSGATLDPATGYFVVFEDTASGASSGYGLNFTDNNAEDSGAESDWGIADDSWSRNMNGAVWASSNDKLQIAVRGTVNATPPSTDAMLSGLTVNDGTSDLTLDPPTFAAGTFDYAVSVENAVTSITIMPMLSDSNATVAYLDENDVAISDDDTNTTGHQVALDVGETVINVVVTAEDDSTQTYTLMVTRTPPPPTDVWSASIMTGTLSTLVGVWPDRSPEIGTITDSDFIYDGVTYSFNVIRVTSSGNLQITVTPAFTQTTIDDLTFQADGASFALSDGSLSNNDRTVDWFSTGLSWSDRQTIAVKMVMQGGGAPASDDATLSGLTVNDGTNDLTLAPAFASGTFIYTADVANAVDEVTLTAMRADDGAVVSTVTLGGTGIADTDFNDGIITVSDLVEGPNIIVVTVTAEDTTTMQPYTVTVTRAMPPPPPPAGVEVPNNWSLIPSGLGAGDGFRLIFLSSTKRNGSATDIATYNTFVQDRATAGHTDIQTYSPGFRVVGCTPDTDARDNTATTGAGVPIYWLDGNKIADDYADFYDGTWDDEANDKNESGTDGPDTSMTGNYPLTGCDDDGTESFSGSASLGLGGLGASFVRVGRPDSNILSTHGPLSSLSSAPNTANRPMYGLSQVFTVAGSAPPPPATTPATTLVSNIGQNHDGGVNVGNLGGAQRQFAQRFTTGSNSGGYILNDVTISLDRVDAGAMPVITIRAASGSGDDPVNTVLHTLTPLASVALGEITFGAPAGAMLASDTSYFVVMANDNTAEAGRYGVETTEEDGEDADGLAGWTIADAGRQKSGASAWGTVNNVIAFLVRLRGSAIDPPSDDATLSELTVNDGTSDHTIDLASPSLDVANAVDTVTLSATPTDSNATVSAVTLGGTAIADSDFSDGIITVSGLMEGANEIVLTVTAENADTRDYTLTVMRNTPADRTASVAAWLPRFGRTVSEQVVEAAQARMAAAPVAGLAGQLAGQTIAIAPGRGSAEARAAAKADFAALGESFFGAGNATGNAWDDIGDGRDGAAERGYSSRALTGRDFLTGSAFALTGDGGDSAATLWGRGAVTSFDGRDGSLSLDGEVVSGMLGIDWRNGERSGGLMLSRSRGEGDYRSSAAGGATSDDGRISATLTGLYPWLGHRVNDRLTLWGVAGYGRGTLTLTPAGEDALSAGIGLTMGSVGARGALGAGAEGVVLAWEADALALRTTSDAASGVAGRLDATSSGVTRLLLGLTGSRRFRLGSGAALTPGLEVGLRHDGGDAETGFGADIGVSLDFADPARGITAALSARGLLDHAASDFRERGLSVTLTWDQRPGSDLGWSLSLGHGVGAATEGGAASLLAQQTLEGLAGDAGAEGDLQRRFDATLGYGVPMAAGRLVAISGIGFGLTDTGREYSVGWRLGLARSGPMDLHLGLEAIRQESVTGSPTHDLGLDLGAAIRW